MKQSCILVALGTRPEAIKLVSLIRALRSAPAHFRVVVVTTSQHRDMVDPILDFFSVAIDHDLDIMTEGQGPSEVTARVLTAISPVLDTEHPDLVIVQGDTSSAMAAALAAFYREIPVGHVEAGLRTGDRYHPFPEEINRRLLSQLATLHFAPTEANRENLLRENIPDHAITITGNTVIDTLLEIESRAGNAADQPRSDGALRTILLTTHRRESFGEPQRQIFQAINALLARNPDIEVLFPVHPNPRVVEAVAAHLHPHPRLHTVPPLPYIDFIAAMSHSYLVVSDSGGVQEEAPALGKPVIVLRTTTERNEVLASGNAMLVSLERDEILAAIESLLTDKALYASMAHRSFPFGSGDAAEKIVRRITTFMDNDQARSR